MKQIAIYKFWWSQGGEGWPPSEPCLTTRADGELQSSGARLSVDGTPWLARPAEEKPKKGRNACKWNTCNYPNARELLLRVQRKKKERRQEGLQDKLHNCEQQNALSCIFLRNLVVMIYLCFERFFEIRDFCQPKVSAFGKNWKNRDIAVDFHRACIRSGYGKNVRRTHVDNDV
ncbi:hypothetical protein OS493_025749, partial [Desmophyllum pertusum]